MAEKDVFRQQRKPAFNPQESVVENSAPPSEGVQITGNVPPALQAAISDQPQQRMKQNRVREMGGDPSMAQFRDVKFDELMARLNVNQQYDEITLPSLGKFYNSGEAPSDGIVHIRPMTGTEEQVLATPRFVKGGNAIDRILKACIQESIQPESLLSIDRTYLLIYLRGISYGSEYDVELQCPECRGQFSHAIDLDTMDIFECPEGFDANNLTAVLPASKFKITYRLSSGKDEKAILDYRERKIKEHGDGATDDTFLHRMALLIQDIEGITNFNAIKVLVSRLPVGDLSFLRNVVNEPPFGVETELGIICPSCTHEFKVDMPFEASFFSPPPRKESATTS